MRRQNIIVIVMDTARAATVLNDEEVAPNLHRIASRGTTFTNAFTTAPWTMPSHASLFTGQYTSDHGTHAGSKQFDPGSPPIAELLNDQGYQTAAFSNNVWISPEFGFDRGFDDFYVGWKLFDDDVDLGRVAKEYDGRLEQSRAIGRHLLRRGGYKTLCNALYTGFLRKLYDDGALLTNHRIKKWLETERNSAEPFFMFVNYLEPHLEYRPPRGYREQFLPDGVTWRDVRSVNQDPWAYVTGSVEMTTDDFTALMALYRAELSYLDQRIGNLVRYIEERDDVGETTVMILGDHGENIGDHGLMDHQYCLYDTLLHVPLVIAGSAFSQNTSLNDLIEIRDLYPTILGVANCEMPDDETVSSHTLIGNRIGREYVLGEYITPQPPMEALDRRFGEVQSHVKTYDKALRSIRTLDWKLIEGSDGATELYRISDDPDEKRDLSGRHRKEVERLQERLNEALGTEFGKREHSRSNVDEGTRDRLEQLGYLE